MGREQSFLEPPGLTKSRLAKGIDVPVQRIGEIVAGKRAVTADTELRLAFEFNVARLVTAL